MVTAQAASVRAGRASSIARARPTAHPPRSPHQLVHGLDNTFLAGIAVVALMAVIAFGVFLAWAQPAGSEESYAAGFAAAEDGPARTMFEANKDAVASCETAWDAEKKFADFHPSRG